MSESNLREHFTAALNRISNPPLDGNNPHFKSKFATLKSILATVKDACSEAGITYSQTIESGDKGMLLCSYINEGAETLRLSSIPIPEFPDPQKLGSYVTYIRRYVAMTDFCIVGDPDDDGNEAAGNGPKGDMPPNENNDMLRAKVALQGLRERADKLGFQSDYVEVTSTESFGKEPGALTLDELRQLYSKVKNALDYFEGGDS